MSPNINPSLSPNLTQNLTPSPQPHPPAPVSPVEDPSKERETQSTPACGPPLSERQSAGTPQPARTPGAEEARMEAAVEGMTDQVKKSTLNPNAKEFNPNKPPLALPSSTPTGNQPPQHTTPSPGQTPQSGPQSLYHSAPLSAATPPNLPPGHSSPQASYSLQGYGLHGPQAITHTYSALGQLAQAHVPGPMSAPHHSGNHGPPQVVMLHAPPPQAGHGSAPQHPQHGPQQGPPQHFAYIGHHSAVQVQPHPSQQIPFHPPGN
ncbi:hypothetical protein SRHO_G00162860 [Serrasalmus rhombeus]